MARYRLEDHHGQVTTPAASFLRIATHLLADWRPWRPPHYATALLGFVHGNAMHRSGRWAATPEGADYEKQWKSIASWAFGTAFCRDALDRLGYGAVVPVSVLAGSQPIHARPGSPWSTLVGSFQNSVQVVRPSPGLMPDLLALHPATSTLAFVEAKGTKYLLGGTTIAKKLKKTWYPQVANADALIAGQRRAARRFVVVTRLNPFAKRPPNREVEVRVFEPTSGSPSHAASGSDGGSDEDSPVRIAGTDPQRSLQMGPALDLLNLGGLLQSFGLSGAASLAIDVSAACAAESEERVNGVLRDGNQALIPAAQRELQQLRARRTIRRAGETDEELFALGGFSAGEFPRVTVGLDETALTMLETAVRLTIRADAAFEELTTLGAAEDRSRHLDAAEDADRVYFRGDGVVGWTDEEQ